MSTSKTQAQLSMLRDDIYGNLQLSPTMFLYTREKACPLPLDARVAADLALLARSRAILFVGTALYLADLNDGHAYLETDIVRRKLLVAASEVQRQYQKCVENTFRRAPGGESFHQTVKRLLRSESWGDNAWIPSYWNLLEHAEVQLKRYDTLLLEVKSRSSEKQVEKWLAFSGDDVWRVRHDSAVALMRTWFILPGGRGALRQVWEGGLQTLRRGWSGLGL